MLIQVRNERGNHLSSQDTRGQPHSQEPGGEEVHVRALRPQVLHQEGRAEALGGAHWHEGLPVPVLSAAIRQEGPFGAPHQKVAQLQVSVG